jgi:Kef-type K+ transport system membrane component KefB
MGVVEFIRVHAHALPPLAKFALGMVLIFGIPPLSRRVRLPGVVGLLLSVVVVGPHVLGLFGEHRPIADFFADLGRLLLMFAAGLDMDLARFRQTQGRSITFGIITASVPLLLGTAVGLVFDYGLIAAIVVGSLLASHTLLGSRVVAELGANRLEPVTVTVGATLLSDTLSLVVFAICVSTYESGFSISGVALQLVEIAVFVPVILFGLSRLGAYALAKAEGEEHAYFVLMFGIMAVAGVVARAINLPGIVGAFLAGLAVNAATHDKPAKEKLEFFGNAFFVPIFYVVTGFLIDPLVFIPSIIDNFSLVSAIFVALIAGKWIAAEVAGRAFRYTLAARMTMWSLTLPQVATTLAATLVAFSTFNPLHQRLIDLRMLHVILVLMLITATLGPVLTQYVAPYMLDDPSAKKALNV